MYRFLHKVLEFLNGLREGFSEFEVKVFDESIHSILVSHF